MKLSEKGLKRLYDEAVTYENDGEVVCHPINQSAVVALQNFDFECKDFEDAVILTVEEAKAVTDMLKGDLDYYHYKTGQIHYPTVKLIDMMENRLKQST